MYRLTPRQAIVIMTRSGEDRGLAPLRQAMPELRFDALREALLRDAIATAVQVDGATISVLAATAVEGGLVRSMIPAGIDLLVTPGTMPLDQQMVHIIERAAKREIERLLFLDAAALGLVPRLVGTALTALAEADVSVGGFPSGSAYAVGLRPQQIAAGLNGVALANDGLLRLVRLDRGLDAVLAAALATGLRSRRLEPRPTLDAFADVPALLGYLDARPEAGRLLGQWRRSCMPPVMASSVASAVRY